MLKAIDNFIAKIRRWKFLREEKYKIRKQNIWIKEVKEATARHQISNIDKETKRLSEKLEDIQEYLEEEKQKDKKKQDHDKIKNLEEREKETKESLKKMQKNKEELLKDINRLTQEQTGAKEYLKIVNKVIKKRE